MKKLLKRRLRHFGDRAISSLSAAPSLARLHIKPGRAGFFGEVFCAIIGIRLAERLRLYARMVWGPRSAYFDAEHALDGDIWGTFFDRSNFDFRDDPSEIEPVFSVPYKPGAHDFVPYEGVSIRRSVGQALRSWCQPNPAIAKAADEAEALLFAGRPMLGVHVRLTDAAAGYEDRQTLDLQHYFDAVDTWISGNAETGIFLATDEDRIVAAFLDRYGPLVAFQACLRSANGTSVHGHYDNGLPGSGYEKGREVFIDALLLSRTVHLIRTHSRVTDFSLCWTPDLPFRDLELEITGVNRTPWLHHP